MMYAHLRSNNASRRIPYAAAALLALAAGTARAGYNLTTLALFNGSNGSDPLGGLILSGNTLYGTTSGGIYGGPVPYGSVFSLPLTGGTPTILGALNYSNGATPSGKLLLSGNTLYGTAYQGGASGYGSVFSVPLTGGTPSVLASFNGPSGSNGSRPNGGVILSGNTLYGTTSDGNNLFSVPLTGGPPTTLAIVGRQPAGNLLLSGNTLYGITNLGGAGGSDYGSVFSVPLTGGKATVLASFNISNGQYPNGGLILSGNTLYGTTGGDNIHSEGTVFSVPVTGGTPTVLTSFNGSNGQVPSGGLILSGNTLYGVTRYGGAGYVNGQQDSGDGTVFSVPVTGGAPTVLASFNGSNGMNPNGGLILSGNTLYGTASQGGASGVGTVFALDLTKPAPIVSLTATASTAFGSKVGTLTLVGGPGPTSATFTATPTGYLTVFNASTSTEIYALLITDSVAGNLAADLADAVSEINAASYGGYSLTASTSDPIGQFGSGYDFYLTFSALTLGTGSPYFGFDFTQLNGISDTLSVDAVAAMPEPASVALLALGGAGLLLRRRRSA